MKIGMFTDTYYPQINGVATSVLILKQQLELAGHSVHIFTTTNANVMDEEKGVYRVPSIPFSSVGRIGFFYPPAVFKVIKKMQLDVIHVHTEFPMGILGYRAAKKLNLPLVHTMHTLYEDYTHYIFKFTSLEKKAKPLARKLCAISCNRADQVIAPTGKTRDLLISYGVHRDISMIPTGINLDQFSPTKINPQKLAKLRTELGIAPNDKILVNIGRISKEKNLSEILETMRVYLPRHKDVKLLLVGDGPAKQDLEIMTKTFGLQEQVIFAGPQPWEQIGSYYSLGHIFVGASQSETQGLTYIEALASGLPVVAKADPCLEGVVKDGVNGYTFHDRKQFIQILDIVLGDQQYHTRLSKQALQSCAAFTAANFAQSIEEIYRTRTKKAN